MEAQVAVVANELYPVSGPVIKEGVVLIKGGKIQAVGPRGRLAVPAGFRIIKAKVATPGLIDTHTVVGLAGYLNQDQDQDELDRSEAMQPELRAVDAYDPHAPLIAWLRSFGITTLHTGHAPGALIAGQTMVVKTRGNSVEEALLKPLAMVAATLGGTAYRGGKAPGTRARAVALLRQLLVKAENYAKKRQAQDPEQRPDRNLRLEILQKVLEGKVPLLITAQRARDIETALRLQREFRFKLVLDGAAEAYLASKAIKQAGVPVIVHPPMARAQGSLENAAFDLAVRLQKLSIPFTFQSGFESYVPKTRVVLFEAAIAVREGLPLERALAALTLDAARLLGLEQRLGSLAPGKDADLALYDGNPFEYTSHCVGTLIDGQLLWSGRR